MKPMISTTGSPKLPTSALAAMELMRQINYDYDPIADRVSRVLEVIDVSSG